jgi:hypothetical protein
MSIKVSIDELDRIKAEIARNNAQNKILRKRAKSLETQILDYLQSKAQAGVKYNGKSIVLEAREKHTRKGKIDKQRDTVSFLRDLGVSDPENAYSQLLQVQKGDAIEQYKLRIKKLKN